MAKKSKNTLGKKFYTEQPIFIYPDYNEYSLGGLFRNTVSKLDAVNSRLTDNFMDSKFGQGLSGLGIKSTGLGSALNTGVNFATSLFNKDGNQTGIGNAMQKVGSLASNIPGVGGIIGAAVNLAGGIVNAGFGSNINEEFVDQTEANAKQLSMYMSNAGNNQQLLSDYSNLSLLQDVNKSDVGSEGWWSNKATDETNRLNNLQDEANLRALRSFDNTAENIEKNNLLMMQAQRAAYGGPLNIFDEGGYKNVYEMPFIQRNQYARTGKITNAGYPVTPLGKGYKTMRALSRFKKAFKERPWDPNGAFTTSVKGFIDDAKNASGSENKKNLLQFSKYLYNQFVGNKGQNLGLLQNETESKKFDNGGPTEYNNLSLEDFITKKINDKRASSLEVSRSRTEPCLPVIGGQKSKNSCIYTATDNYGSQYRVPGNWTFYENPKKYGFTPIDINDAQPSDIIQVFDGITPYHALTLDSFDNEGRMKFNYSRGSSGDSSDIVKSSVNFPNTKKKAYRFTGTPADSLQWKNEYMEMINKKADGGNLFTNGVTMVNNGGTHEYLEGQEYDVTEEEIKLLKKLGYEFEYL